MVLKILAVDKDVNVFKRELSAWSKHGIDILRVDTMGAAIEMIRRNPFFFVVINADNIAYKPQLKIMRDASPTYIFIITTNFSMSEQTEALHLGADGYTKFQDDPDIHIEFAMALIDRYNERHYEMNRPKNQFEVVSFGDFFFYPQYRQLFCNETEIFLTKKEFDLLRYLIKNRGRPLTYTRIFQHVWGAEYIDSSKNTLNCVVRRLRKKLSIAPNKKCYIKTIYQTGYRFVFD